MDWLDITSSHFYSVNIHSKLRGYIMSEEQMAILFPDMYGDELLTESMHIIEG